MKVIKANKYHKEQTLKLLDDFRTCCVSIINPEINYISDTAKNFGSTLFDEVINSNSSAIFLIEDNNNFIGIATVHKIPQIRKGEYCAEIEEMFISNKYQGKGLALLLTDAIIEWAKENNIKNIRLESDNHLKQAHSFYNKAGFILYGNAYQKTLS